MLAVAAFISDLLLHRERVAVSWMLAASWLCEDEEDDDGGSEMVAASADGAGDVQMRDGKALAEKMKVTVVMVAR